jgi:cellulose synthase operon protein C
MNIYIRYSYISAFLVLSGLISQPVLSLTNSDVLIAQAQSTSESQVRQAYTLLRRGDVNRAIASFQAILRRYPQSIDARLGLAIAYRRQGLINEAWTTYGQVLDQDPTNQLALSTVGQLAAFRPDWQEKGIQALTTLLNFNPNDLEARAQRALLYGYRGNFADAVADYQIVLANNPTPNVLLDAAQIYTFSGNPQEGIALFNRYQEVSGKSISGDAAIAYGRALRQTNNTFLAITVLKSELESPKISDEQTVRAIGELSLAYLDNGQNAEALAILETLRNRGDELALLTIARSLNEIGTKTNQQNFSEEAALIYRQVLERNFNPSPSLIREVADVLSGVPSQQQYSLALYRQLASREPEDKSLLVLQLALEKKLGNISQTELMQRLQIALQSLPTNPGDRERLAQALVRIDSPEPILLNTYQSLIASGVNQPFLYFRIAQMYLQSNELRAAKDALRAYISTPQGARDPSTELLLADIDLREGNLEASAGRYESLIATNPADSSISQAALRGLAGVRVIQKRSNDALVLYDRLVALNPQNLTYQLGQASLAYQVGRISEQQANSILNSWLAARSSMDISPELFGLVATLPPSAERESLYKDLLKVDPNNIPIQLRLVQVVARRNPNEARILVRQLIANNPSNIGAYFVQGQLGQDIGDLDLASNSYETILKLEPENADALSALGGVRFQERRYDDAEDLYNRAIAIRPQDWQVRISLATVAVARDLPLKALQDLEQLQIERSANGQQFDSEFDRRLNEQKQRIEESLIRRRGFQPPWERFGFE